VPNDHPTQVYTDGSACAGNAAAAYFVNRRTFEAVVCGPTSSFTAELSAIELALDSLPGRLAIMCDHAGIGRLLRCSTTGTVFVQAAAKYPQLVRVRAKFDAQQCLIHHCVGHGNQSPPGMRFVDHLSRAISRRATKLGLAPGDKIDNAAFGFGARGRLLDKLQLAICQFDQGNNATLHLPTYHLIRAERSRQLVTA
jgi:hypothetical protein